MMSKRFTVKNFKGVSSAVWVLTGLMALVAVIQTLANGIQPLMFISFGLFLLPFWISVIWLERYQIKVNGHSITVRRAFAPSYSLDVSEIDSVKWIVNETRMGQMENIRIRAGRHHFHAETLMCGFEKMGEYIRENVDGSKITVKQNRFFRGK